MKKSFLILSALYIAAMAVAQDVLVIPYNTTSLTEEQRNANPDYIVYPTSLEGVDEVDMICNKYVDLGLPSGTKWAKCNVGASTPEEYGDYFAWGETEPKDNYGWSTYKWYDESTDQLTKYCTDAYYGTVDNKTTLEPEDDAATVNWGDDWRIPTQEEWKELLENCTWTWTTENGVNGYIVISSNGNKIFLPAAGMYEGSSNNLASTYGFYRSSSLLKAMTFDYVIYFDGNIVTEAGEYSCEGLSVRPVLNK